MLLPTGMQAAHGNRGDGRHARTHAYVGDCHKRSLGVPFDKQRERARQREEKSERGRASKRRKKDWQQGLRSITSTWPTAVAAQKLSHPRRAAAHAAAERTPPATHAAAPPRSACMLPGSGLNQTRPKRRRDDRPLSTGLLRPCYKSSSRPRFAGASQSPDTRT